MLSDDVRVARNFQFRFILLITPVPVVSQTDFPPNATEAPRQGFDRSMPGRSCNHNGSSVLIEISGLWTNRSDCPKQQCTVRMMSAVLMFAHCIRQLVRVEWSGVDWGGASRAVFGQFAMPSVLSDPRELITID
jgi:hypothetical protein